MRRRFYRTLTLVLSGAVTFVATADAAVADVSVAHARLRSRTRIATTHVPDPALPEPPLPDPVPPEPLPEPAIESEPFEPKAFAPDPERLAGALAAPKADDVVFAPLPAEPTSPAFDDPGAPPRTFDDPEPAGPREATFVVAVCAAVVDAPLSTVLLVLPVPLPPEMLALFWLPDASERSLTCPTHTRPRAVPREVRPPAQEQPR